MRNANWGNRKNLGGGRSLRTVTLLSIFIFLCFYLMLSARSINHVNAKSGGGGRTGEVVNGGGLGRHQTASEMASLEIKKKKLLSNIANLSAEKSRVYKKLFDKGSVGAGVLPESSMEAAGQEIDGDRTSQSSSGSQTPSDSSVGRGSEATTGKTIFFSNTPGNPYTTTTTTTTNNSSNDNDDNPSIVSERLTKSNETEGGHRCSAQQCAVYLLHFGKFLTKKYP